MKDKLTLCLVCSILFVGGCGKQEDNAPPFTIPKNDRQSSPEDITSRPAGIPQSAEPVVAIVHFRSYLTRGGIDTPIVPSDLTDKSLIAKLGQLLEDPNYDITKLKGDCLSGRVEINQMGLDILLNEGVKESDIAVLAETNQSRLAELKKQLADRQALDDRVRALGVDIHPPEGWQEPFVIGEKKPFITELVMQLKRFSPLHHLIWIDSKHESTQGEIEVLVFAAGGFPLGIVAISPESWIRTGGTLSTWRLDEGDEVVAGPIQFKHNRGVKVRATFENSDMVQQTNRRMVEDAVYFSSNNAFVAIRLRASQEFFEDMAKNVFRPFLDSVILQAPATEQNILAFADDGFVYTSKLDGSNRQRLTSGEAPNWSPDGSMIAYSKDGGGVEVFSVIRETTTLLSTFGQSPKWSPDGKYLLFESDGWIYVMDAAGREKRKIGKHIGLGCPPQWFPNSNRILYVGGSEESPEIRSVPREGGTFQTIGKGLSVALSPDGSRVAVVGMLMSLEDGSRQLMLSVNSIADANLRVVYTEPAPAEGDFFLCPVWSPSGDAIALPRTKVVREQTTLPKTVVDVLLFRDPDFVPEMIFEALQFPSMIHGARVTGIPYHVYGVAWAPSEDQIVLATIEPLFLPGEAFVIPGLRALRPQEEESLNKALDADQLVIIDVKSVRNEPKRIGGGHSPTVSGGVSWSLY